ncbi:MAG TPA: phosphatase PAP2 family protein [Jatrophihabitantaceae bacterium]|jgi:membrane-associated phospholipid phosphatase|nr:phosphatase PAP2 family protein [Jatrophihabitantaceae bacterium]
MVVLFGVFVLGLALVLVVGAVTYRAQVHVPWFQPVAWSRELGRRIPVVPAALLIGLAGTEAAFLIGLPTGWAAAALEDSVDWPVFRWVSRHVHDGVFTDLMNACTKMGNIFEIRVACIIGAIVLALAWRKYFYIPPIIILSTFILEKFAQKALAKIIDRGHPPTTLGTYPSGGVARLLSIVGVMVFLALLLVPNLSRRLRFTVWTGFAGLVWIETFSRTYLSKHWITDAIGGVVLGTLLLFSVVGATAALTRNIAPAYGGSVSFDSRPTPRTDDSADPDTVGAGPRHAV